MLTYLEYIRTLTMQMLYVHIKLSNMNELEKICSLQYHMNMKKIYIYIYINTSVNNIYRKGKCTVHIMLPC